MQIVSLLRSAWSNLVHRDHVEAALDDELRAYVDLLAAENERNGMSADQARRAALVATRGVDQVKESTRDAWAGNAIAIALRELRYALRSLRRSPGFVAISVATLGIGIGGATAIFIIIDAALLRPLPVASEPDRLISAERVKFATSELDDFSYEDYRDLQAQTATLAGLAAYNGTSLALETRSGTGRAWVSYVSDNFFDVLGVRPALGRVINATDGNAPGANPVVVLGYDIWKNRFGGDSSVIGSTIKLDLQLFTIVGVAPKGFIGAMRLHRMELWIPFGAMRLSPDDYFESRGWRWLRLVGRLAPRATADGAQRELSGIAARLESAYPVDKGRGIRVFTGAGITDDERVATSRLPRLLSIAIGLLLLIACANVASLSLVRAAAKQRELATRLALGASRASLVGRLFIEGAVLAVGASVVGLFIAQTLTRSASIVSTVVDMDDLDLRMDWRVLGTALATTGLTAILVSVVPAFQVSRTELGILIKDGTGGAVGRRSRRQRALVVVQLAASLVLLASAGIIYSAFQRVLETDPGFEPRGLTAAWVGDLRSSGYDSTRSVAFYRALLSRAESDPALTGAALTGSVLLRWAPRVSVFRRGEEPPGGHESESGLRVRMNKVSPSLFDVMQIPVLFGRRFTPRDDERQPLVAIVSRRLAEAFWPNQSAVGQYISWPARRGSRRAPLEVVGVVADIRPSLSGDPAMTLYVPVDQHPDANTTLLMRGRGNIPPAVSTLHDLAAGIDPRVAVRGGETLVDLLDDEVHVQRIASAWIGVFGVIALLLASIGLYGVVAQNVVQRTRELAVRSALGATPRGLLGLVLGDGMRLAAMGAAFGVIASVFAMRLLRNLFTVVAPTDAKAVPVATVVLVVSMLAANYLPARRAARLNPVDALRCD